MRNSTRINVKFPKSGKTYTFKSVRAVARMLSGNGTASGGLRQTIDDNAYEALGGVVRKVRNNAVRG